VSARALIAGGASLFGEPRRIGRNIGVIVRLDRTIQYAAASDV
jgi:hypothetical protein